MSVEFMPIDVRVLSHPKMVRALKAGGPAVLWTWLGILAWTHEHNGDWLPEDCIGVPSGPDSPRTRSASVDHLVSVGLLDRSHRGIRPHDFDLWEASSDSATRRRYERDRKKAQRKPGKAETGSGTCPGHFPDSVPDTVDGVSPRARETRSDETRSDEMTTDLAPVPATLDGIRDDDRETPCPLDLADRWRGAATMAQQLKIPEAAVRAVADDFVAYWTIGGGSGRRRSRWARRLREEVRRHGPAKAAALAVWGLSPGQPPPASAEEMAHRNALCDAADARARAELMGGR